MDGNDFPVSYWLIVHCVSRKRSLRKLLHDLFRHSIPPKQGQPQHLIAEGLEGKLHSGVSLVHQDAGDAKAQHSKIPIARSLFSGDKE